MNDAAKYLAAINTNWATWKALRDSASIKPGEQGFATHGEEITFPGRLAYHAA